MALFKKPELTEEDLGLLTQMLPEYLAAIDLKAELYTAEVPRKLIDLALRTESEECQVAVLRIVEDFLYDSYDLTNFAHTRAVELSMALLSGSGVSLHTSALKFLQSLCQHPESAKSLLERHDVLKVALNLTRQLSAVAQPLDDAYVDYLQALISFLYIFCTINEQVGVKLVRSEMPPLLVGLIGPATGKTEALAVLLGTIQLLSQQKYGAQLFVDNGIGVQIRDILLAYGEQKCPSEAVQIAANIVGTIAQMVPYTAVKLFEVRIPSLLYEIGVKIDKNDDRLMGFVISALTEVLYATRNLPGQGFFDCLQKIGQIDDVLEFFCHLPDRFEDPDECYSIYGALMTIIGGVSKAQDFVRISALSRGAVPELVRGLENKQTTIRSKISLLDALAALLKRQPIPPTIQVTELPACTAAVLQVKREFANLYGKKSEDRTLCMQAAESAKSVLERLGHSEGRNPQKMQMYTMLIIGAGMLCVAAVRGLIWAFK